jgi:hypothetical protein
MIQRSEHLHFGLETCDTLGIGRKRFGQNFDLDVTIEFHVAHAMGLAHATRTDEGDDFIHDPDTWRETRKLLRRTR